MSDHIPGHLRSELDLSDETFEREVMEPRGALVVVDFWATWCGPCRPFGDTFERLAGSMGSGSIRFAKVNVDDCPKSSERMGIRSIPTTVMVRNGMPIDRIVGNASEADLRTRIEAQAK